METAGVEPLPAESAGGKPHGALEAAREVTLVRETRAKSDFREPGVRLHQESLCQGHPASHEVTVWCYAERAVEYPEEVGFGKPDMRRDVRDVNAPFQFCVDEILDETHPAS
jgi:hypothetical protein